MRNLYRKSSPLVRPHHFKRPSTLAEYSKLHEMRPQTFEPNQPRCAPSLPTRRARRTSNVLNPLPQHRLQHQALSANVALVNIQELRNAQQPTIPAITAVVLAIGIGLLNALLTPPSATSVITWAITIAVANSGRKATYGTAMPPPRMNPRQRRTAIAAASVRRA